MFRKIFLSHSAYKYFVVGILAFSSDYVLLLVSYYVIGLPLKIATTIGFFTGFLISFTINKQWVFGGKQKKNTNRQVIEYLILLGFNYVFTVWTVNLLNEHKVGPAISKLFVMVLIMCWNYVLFRWIIFRAED